MSKLTKAQLSVKTKNKICVDKAGNTIRKLCASLATKNVLVDCSADPLE